MVTNKLKELKDILTDASNLLQEANKLILDDCKQERLQLFTELNEMKNRLHYFMAKVSILNYYELPEDRAVDVMFNVANGKQVKESTSFLKEAAYTYLLIFEEVDVAKAESIYKVKNYDFVKGKALIEYDIYDMMLANKEEESKETVAKSGLLVLGEIEGTGCALGVSYLDYEQLKAN